MSSIKNIRSLFAFTSPRTLEKIIPEIDMLSKQFGGKKWNGQSQVEFYDKLVITQDFKSSTKARDKAFAARDRINRAPKALGFVVLKPVVYLTDAGRELVNGSRKSEIITRQLLKFQLPSPNYQGGNGRFLVRPYLELLRMLHDLEGISKFEIAFFFTQLLDYRDYDFVLDKIKEFRIAYHDNKTLNKREFLNNVAIREVKRIYKTEIESGDTSTRESSDVSLSKFIKTKISNLYDYADAFIRYISATMLTAYDAKNNRIVVNSFSLPDVEFILTMVDRNPVDFDKNTDFFDYIGDSTQPTLLCDDRNKLMSKLKCYLGSSRSDMLDSMHVDDLKDRIEIEETRIAQAAMKKTEMSLKNYAAYDDIIEHFQLITDRRSVIDPSLIFEWNMWRTFVMLNYAKEVNGGFSKDQNGLPRSYAPGNQPDLVVEYDSFILLVEVTLSKGAKQYEMEGEPVARHFGTISRNSNKPVYCLFIAPKINEATMSHFYMTNISKVAFYGGSTRIVAISLQQFLRLVELAKERGFNDEKKMKSLLDAFMSFTSTEFSESIWVQHIEASLSQWLV